MLMYVKAMMLLIFSTFKMKRLCVWAAAGPWQQGGAEEAVPGGSAGDHPAISLKEDGHQVENCKFNSLPVSLRLCRTWETTDWGLCVQELQQFEQYIFSDYSDLILVQNVYDDVLRSILRKEIETGKRHTPLLSHAQHTTK